MFKILTVCLFALNLSNGAKILGIFNVPVYSHYILGHRLLEALAENGHEVTMVSAFGKENTIKNYKNVHITGMLDRVEEMKKNQSASENFNDKAEVGEYGMYIMAQEIGLIASDFTLASDNVQKLIHGNKHFDLVIIEQFVNDALKGFCHLYKSPCVAFSTIGANHWVNAMAGNPSPPSYIPDIFLSYGSDMTFFERVQNIIFQTFTYLVCNFRYESKHNTLLQKYFPNSPHVSTLMTNISLILLNSHVSTNQAVPHVPNMVEIGGFHVKTSNKLSGDLKKYLDDANEGFVYFSLGSNVKSNELPDDKRNDILKAFSKLKLKVLWKFENGNLPGKPDNVKISKWLPQTDVLAHKNIKMFITHGGLLSTTEAVHYGVPVIGIPIFGDQKMNMAQTVRNGFGLMVTYQDLNEKTLSDAMNKIIEDKSYMQNAKKRSKIMHDQPIKPVDTAIFWLEYVMRHEGAVHLRTAGAKLPLYKYLNLDVLLFFVLMVNISIILLCKICCSNKNQKRIQSNSKKNK